MNVSALTAQNPNSLQNLLQGRYEDYTQLQNALQSGNITNAQHAFAAFQQDAQKTAQLSGGSGLFSSGSAASKDLQVLGSALNSADLTGAQRAFMNLTQDIANAGRGDQVIDNVSLHHPSRATAISQGAKAFGTNAAFNGNSQVAGTVLNRQA